MRQKMGYLYDYDILVVVPFDFSERLDISGVPRSAG